MRSDPGAHSGLVGGTRSAEAADAQLVQELVARRLLEQQRAAGVVRAEVFGRRVGAQMGRCDRVGVGGLALAVWNDVQSNFHQFRRSHPRKWGQTPSQGFHFAVREVGVLKLERQADGTDRRIERDGQSQCDDRYVIQIVLCIVILVGLDGLDLIQCGERRLDVWNGETEASLVLHCWASCGVQSLVE